MRIELIPRPYPNADLDWRLQQYTQWLSSKSLSITEPVLLHITVDDHVFRQWLLPRVTSEATYQPGDLVWFSNIKCIARLTREPVSGNLRPVYPTGFYSGGIPLFHTSVLPVPSANGPSAKSPLAWSPSGLRLQCGEGRIATLTGGDDSIDAITVWPLPASYQSGVRVEQVGRHVTIYRYAAHDTPSTSCLLIAESAGVQALLALEFPATCATKQPLKLLPLSAYLDAGQTQAFTATGGTGSYTWDFNYSLNYSVNDAGNTFFINRLDNNLAAPIESILTVTSGTEQQRAIIRSPAYTKPSPPPPQPPVQMSPPNKWVQSSITSNDDYTVAQGRGFTLGTCRTDNGRRYQEFVLNETPTHPAQCFGIVGDAINGTLFHNPFVCVTANGRIGYQPLARERHSTIPNNFLRPLQKGDTVGFAIDFDDPLLPVWISLNGQYLGDGDPVASKNPTVQLKAKVCYRTFISNPETSLITATLSRSFYPLPTFDYFRDTCP